MAEPPNQFSKSGRIQSEAKRAHVNKFMNFLNFSAIMVGEQRKFFNFRSSKTSILAHFSSILYMALFKNAFIKKQGKLGALFILIKNRGLIAPRLRWPCINWLS